jgi:hypothetical protein
MFESLPNEVILQIFSFLELTHLHRAFSSLTVRFEQLLHDQLAPLYACLTPDIVFSLEEFGSRIVHLSLIEWKPDALSPLLQQSVFPCLKCLSIKASNNLYFGQPTNNLIHQILSFPKLRKCKIKLSPTLFLRNEELPFSLIEQLGLSMITLDMLFLLLIHVPQLRSLDVLLNSNGRIFDQHAYNFDYNCLHLTSLTLELHSDIKFDEVLFLLPHMPVLRSLKLKGNVWDDAFLNGNRWENILLGENSFPLLKKMNVDLSVRCTRSAPLPNTVHAQFNRKVFKRTKFTLASDRKLWFDLKCHWNS